MELLGNRRLKRDAIADELPIILESARVEALARGGDCAGQVFDRGVIDGVGVNGAGWTTRVTSTISMWWDTWIVDGSVRLGARIVWLFSYPVRMIQDELVQSYMQPFEG